MPGGRPGKTAGMRRRHRRGGGRCSAAVRSLCRCLRRGRAV